MRLLFSTLVALATLCACQQPLHDRYAPYIDATFELGEGVSTRGKADPLKLSTPYISDINIESIGIENLEIRRNTTLDAEGEMRGGEGMVLTLDFVDSAGAKYTDVLGTAVRMRLAFDANFQIVAGSLVGKPNNVAGVWTRYPGGQFKEGAGRMLYLDDRVGTGHFRATFEGFRIHGQFRALVR